MYRPLKSSQSGKWLVGQLSDVAEAVGRVVPRGYESYALVFPRLLVDDGSLARWGEFAELSALVDGASIRQAALAEGRLVQTEFGSMDRDTFTGLDSVLRSGSPVPVTYAIWDGYVDAEPYAVAPSVVLPPERRMLLLSRDDGTDGTLDGYPNGRRPIRWWPADHSWCVGGDIYSTRLVVGGSSEGIKQILTCPFIEAIEVDPRQLGSLD